MFRLVFETFASIYQHIVKQHFEDHNAGGTMVCMWSGCDGMPRQKWSFMAHILVCETLLTDFSIFTLTRFNFLYSEGMLMELRIANLKI